MKRDIKIHNRLAYIRDYEYIELLVKERSRKNNSFLKELLR